MKEVRSRVKEIKEKVNEFFISANLTATYKIHLFKVILKWCNDIKLSNSSLLSINSIVDYFIDINWDYFVKYKNIKQVTMKTMNTKIHSLFEKRFPNKRDKLSNNEKKTIFKTVKNILHNDVFYRFRNDTGLYDFYQLSSQNNIELIPEVPEYIDLEFYKTIKDKIDFLGFEKEMISWLRENSILIGYAINYRFVIFLEQNNENQNFIFSQIVSELE